MLNRRMFLSFAGTLAVSPIGFAQQPARKVALYANVGAHLLHYDVDIAGAALRRQQNIMLPGMVQYAWPHVSHRYLYVATSSMSNHGHSHQLTALRIDAASGALARHGESVRLPARPIHLTTDIPSRHILVAFSDPSGLRVYRIREDFTPGEEVEQPGAIDAGVYAHQVRVSPDNRLAILVTRGNQRNRRWMPTPGALKVFRYGDGVLANGVSIAPDGEHFGPRHLDFHPTRPWIYVVLETQNQIYTYRMEKGRIHPEPAFRVDTLAAPNAPGVRQEASAVHIHPDGRFLYAANRGTAIESDGNGVLSGGENSIVVYAIDPTTGEPHAVQHMPAHGAHVRTFCIDPSGRLLVAEHNRPLNVKVGNELRTLQAGLSVFRIAADGKLSFVRKYDIDVGDSTMWWMGMVGL
jgi:6-phosphogluconolactonase (cycloisomerase 2 family)